MTSMYRGSERFTREQLVFVIEAAMCAVLDKVAGIMPQTEGDKKYCDKTAAESYQFGALYQFGIFVPILWAQLNNDGMGTNDFYGFEEFDAVITKFIEDKWKNPGICHPDFRQLAERIVDGNFEEYLQVPVYSLYCNCVDWPRSDVDREGGLCDLIDTSVTITRRTFLQHVDRQELRALEQLLGYEAHHRQGLTMAGDWHVSYFRSRHHGERVYGFCHSAIEYVFKQVKEEFDADQPSGDC